MATRASFGAPKPSGGVETLQDELRLAIDTIPGLVWTAQPDGHIDFLNQRWLEYTGLTLEDASGWGWQTAIHPDDVAALLDYWRSVLAAGTPGETEARLRRSDGAYRWFLFRGVPLYDDQGRLVKWYGQTTDIEDRKRAETLLAGEKRLLEYVARGRELGEILEALCVLVEDNASGCHCAVTLVDRATNKMKHAAAPTLPSSYFGTIDGRPVFPTAGPCAMAVCEKQQVIVADVLSDMRWEADGWRQLALDHGIRACWSTPILSTTGESLGTFALNFEVPGEPDKHYTDLIEQFTDLASIAIEQRQKEDALRRSEEYLAEAQRLSQTGSFSWRPDNGEIIWSEQTYRIFELDPALKPTLELARSRIHPEDQHVFDGAVQAAGEGNDVSFVERLVLPSGTIRHVHTVARPVAGEDGRPIEFIGAVRDITEAKLREAALNRVRAELAHVSRVTTLGTLTASIAHEVNQPLSGIVTNANVCLRLLSGHPPDIAGASAAAKRSLRDADRAAEIITRLRALFKRQSVDATEFDMNEAMREVIALANSEIQRSHAALKMELAHDLPPVSGDRTQLQQVLLNLVLNAIEAMSEIDDRQRMLTVRSRRQTGGDVHVVVCDNGVGIPKQDVECVFDPFFTTKDAGMGMGLSISRSIVEGHSGCLWAEVSEATSGATFVFSIPGMPTA